MSPCFIYNLRKNMVVTMMHRKSPHSQHEYLNHCKIDKSINTVKSILLCPVSGILACFLRLTRYAAVQRTYIHWQFIVFWFNSFKRLFDKPLSFSENTCEACNIIFYLHMNLHFQDIWKYSWFWNLKPGKLLKRQAQLRAVVDRLYRLNSTSE